MIKIWYSASKSIRSQGWIIICSRWNLTGAFQFLFALKYLCQFSLQESLLTFSWPCSCHFEKDTGITLGSLELYFFFNNVKEKQNLMFELFGKAQCKLLLHFPRTAFVCPQFRLVVCFSHHKYGNRLAHSRQEGKIFASMHSTQNEHLNLLSDLCFLDLGRGGGRGRRKIIKENFTVLDNSECSPDVHQQ